mgnify:FL=1
MGKSKVNQYKASRAATQKQRVEENLVTLGLKGMLYSYEQIAKLALENSSTHYDFFESLLENELNLKEDSRILRWIKQARFPFEATIKEFDFEWPKKINKQKILELASCRFIDKSENVIFLGPPGLGKTHLAISLGREAINNGHDVKFLALDKLIEQVEKTIDNGAALHRTLASFLRPKLLILDEVDIHETQERTSKFLFQLLYQRHEKGSTIFTSNKAFSEWRKIFGDKTKADMIFDRILHHSTIIPIEGDSYRIKDKLKKLKETGGNK